MDPLTRPAGRLPAPAAPACTLGLALGLTLGLCGTAAAADRPDIKPGLWEMQMLKAPEGAQMPDPAKMKAAMDKMQAQMAAMPPAQRARMQQMMGNSGVAFSETGMRSCLTAASLARDGAPMESRPGCSTTVKTRTPQRWAATTVCTTPPSTGEVEAIFESPTSYLVNVKGTRTDQGQQKPFSMSMRYKFVGADCGNVRPMDEVVREQQQRMKAGGYKPGAGYLPR